MNLPILPITQNTPEWHEWRAQGIGASEIAALYGKHPYLTEYQLWLQKTGQAKEFEGNVATEHGQHEEYNAFLTLKEDDCLPELVRGGCIEHAKIPYLRASLDGYCAYRKLLIEIKSPYGQKNRKITEIEQIPDYWVYQVQFQLALCDSYSIQDVEHEGMIYLWLGKNECNRQFCIFKNKTLQDDMIAKASQWWIEHVVMGNPVKPDTIIISQKEVLDKLLLYEEYNRAIKEIDAKKTALKSEIEEFLDGNSNYCTDTHQIIRMAPRSSYDYNAMKRDGIDLSKYKVQKQEGSYIIKRRKH